MLQSGQSLIERSYKADSDLSVAGWEYAERLKDFVIERRAKSLAERGLDPKDRRLVVSLTALVNMPSDLKSDSRYGRPLAAVHITLHGLSLPRLKHRSLNPQTRWRRISPRPNSKQRMPR